MLTSRLKSSNKDMPADLFDCPIAFMGEPAFRLLSRRGLAGTVIATFSRSCWLETPGGQLFAVTDDRSGEGPLAAGAVLPDGLALAEMGVNEGAELVADGVDFRLGNRLILRTVAARMWRPAPLGPRASNDEVARRLRALIDSVSDDVPADGLAPLIIHLDQLAYGDVPTPYDVGVAPRLAMPNVALLAEGVVQDDESAIDQAVQGLVGLGPGLTPSGDDLLGGIMIALRTALGPVSPNESPLTGFFQSRWFPIIDGLSRSIVHHIARTNRISAALLEQAVLGVGSATQHQVAQCLHELTPATGLETAAARLVRWGHTSGWDSLTGILFGTAISLRLAESIDPATGNAPRARVLV